MVMVFASATPQQTVNPKPQFTVIYGFPYRSPLSLHTLSNIMPTPFQLPMPILIQAPVPKHTNALNLHARPFVGRFVPWRHYPSNDATANSTAATCRSITSGFWPCLWGLIWQVPDAAVNILLNFVYQNIIAPEEKGTWNLSLHQDM